MTDLAQQIKTALTTDMVTNVAVDGRYVDFSLNDIPYWARLSRGKFNPDHMRRASY